MVAVPVPLAVILPFLTSAICLLDVFHLIDPDKFFFVAVKVNVFVPASDSVRVVFDSLMEGVFTILNVTVFDPVYFPLPLMRIVAVPFLYYSYKKEYKQGLL